jgi:hypothetical protein
MLGQRGFSIVIIFHVPQLSPVTLVSVEPVIGMQPENIRLVWLFKILQIESALVHIKISFPLFVF